MPVGWISLSVYHVDYQLPPMVITCSTHCVMCCTLLNSIG